MRAAPAACYGKLPARADFVTRRLPRATIEIWDRWLQACLGHSQQTLGAAWQDCYMLAPPWRVALPAGACGQAALIGALVPSVDAVGRCFPLLIAQELAGAVNPAGLAIAGGPWFEAAEALALRALDDGFDLAALESALPALAAPSPAMHRSWPSGGAIGRWAELATPAAFSTGAGGAVPSASPPALWWTMGGVGFSPALAVTAGLISPRGFAALLDGDAPRHGWDLWATDDAGTEEDLAWDRDE